MNYRYHYLQDSRIWTIHKYLRKKHPPYIHHDPEVRDKKIHTDIKRYGITYVLIEDKFGLDNLAEIQDWLDQRMKNDEWAYFVDRFYFKDANHAFEFKMRWK